MHFKAITSWRFYDALDNSLCFNVGHKNVCKSNGHFCTHSSTIDLDLDTFQ